MSKKLIGYVLFFIVLVGAFYYFVFKGTDNWKTKLAVISRVTPFQFTTQDALPFTEKDMLGKVTVVEYFFTTCKGICPKMHAGMQSVYTAFKDQPDFMIVAHTSDPEIDSVARLKVYADSMKIDTRKWVLLTGRKDSLYQQARNAYLLDDPKNNLEKIGDQFIHTQFFALVDRKGNVRSQVYDGLKSAEIKKLQKDIQTLLDEKTGSTP